MLQQLKKNFWARVLLLISPESRWYLYLSQLFHLVFHFISIKKATRSQTQNIFIFPLSPFDIYTSNRLLMLRSIEKSQLNHFSRNKNVVRHIINFNIFVILLLRHFHRLLHFCAFWFYSIWFGSNLLYARNYHVFSMCIRYKFRWQGYFFFIRPLSLHFTNVAECVSHFGSDCEIF